MFNRLDIGMKGLIFLMMLMLDDTFFETLAMWVSHVRNSSFSTPKHLLQLTLFKEIPFRNVFIFSVIVAILCLEPTNINSVFITVFETLNINAHLFLKFRDIASRKSQAGVICVHSGSSKVYNTRKIIDVYQKQEWTKYRALGNSTFDLFMLGKHTIDENNLGSI